MTGQSAQLDTVVVVDDGSRDGTMALLEAHRTVLPLVVVGPRRLPGDVASLHGRIGSAFRTGLDELAPQDDDVVLFADQDDVWERDRVERHLERLSHGHAATAASARCIDGQGQQLPVTLTDVYPRPERWEDLTPAERLRETLVTPLATGAAMAVTGELVNRTPPVPAGWLHDRWYSLAAAATASLDLDPRPVLRYRLHDGQAVGATGSGARAARSRAVAWCRRPTDVARRLRSLHRLRAVSPDTARRDALTYRSLVAELARPRKWGVS